MASSKINAYVQKWLITNPLIINISNPSKLRMRVSLKYNNTEVIARQVAEVVLDEYDVYKLTLTSTERNLIYKLIANTTNPKITLSVQFYNANNTIANTDTKTIDIIVTNTSWVKSNGTWKKAIPFIKTSSSTSWKKGLVWYKDSNGVWKH